MGVVLIVTSAPPLIEGGHLVIARSLQHALIEAGHRASIVTTPSNRFGRQAAAYVANWMTDVGETGNGEPVDQVITLRYPSFAVRHPRHVCWLNHTMREYYDLWDSFSAGLSPQGRAKETVRRTVIRAADTFFLKRHVSRLFAQSSTVQERLRRWNGVASEVLHPPPPPRPYRCRGYGDYLFFVSRLAPLKRADLLLRALAVPAARRIPCVIGGEGEEAAALRALARQLKLGEHVRFVGHVDDVDMVEHLAACRAVVFVPKQEDYGFVTVEALASGKAVITATDSGGPTELIRDGQNGFVVNPDPESLADACVRMMDAPGLAERMGEEGRRGIADLTWANVVQKLVMTP